MIEYCQIELTNQCNLTCAGCFRYNLKRKIGIMPLNIFQQTIELCLKMNLKEVWLHNWGEPLLHPDLLKYVTYASKYFKVGFTTNGTLLTKPMLSALQKSGLTYLDISLNRNTPKEFIYDLLSLYDIAQIIGLNCHFRTVLFNQDDFIHYTNLLCTYKVRYQRAMVDNLKSMRSVDCPAINRLFFVYIDGTVVPCCRVADGEIKYGNVNDKNIVSKINFGIKKINLNIETGKPLKICSHCSEVKDDMPVPYKLGVNNVAN